MRQLTYEGVTHRLSERNWQQMLKRFDAGRARLNAFGYYFVPVRSICVARSYKCVRCPLRDPHKKTNSCTYLFSKIIGDDLLGRVHLRDSGVFWDRQDDVPARQALRKVTDVLTTAVHTSVRGKSRANRASDRKGYH